MTWNCEYIIILIAYGPSPFYLSLILPVRLDHCYIELHYGNVLGTLSLL